ncbi:MAG TPA: sugar phosphate isomerase/epimerase family protein [Roseiflexaceae bacterium]|nr:sugar phosphate isomerase/epimerase family protein [Roseiflexaceae bacterium]
MAEPFPLAYSTLACPAWSLEQAAEAATTYGYSGLELRLLDGEIIPAELPPEGRRRIRDTLRSRELSLVGIGASTRFALADPAERAANGAELRRYLRLAHELECPLVRTFGGTAPAGVSEEQAVAWVAEGLEGPLAEAERLGVRIALETHDSFAHGAAVARVLDRLPHPLLGAIWDVLHPLRHGEPPEATWAALASRLLHVHIKDGAPDPAAARPEEWRLTLLGEGAVPGRAIVALLRANGYRGWLSAEWEKRWHPYLAEPEEALPQHAWTLRAWMEEQ